ncbi:MAG: hypothetical protein AAB392_02645 [Patescibacteria group bacterium]
MPTWIPKKKILISAVSIMILSLLVYFTSVNILDGKIKEIENIYITNDAQLTEEDRMKTIISLSEIHMSSIEALRKFFIENGDEVSFIETIENLAKSNSVQMEIVNISQNKNSSSLIKEDLNIRVNISGKWQDILVFIKGLESLPFGVSVLNTHIDNIDEGLWSGGVDFVVFREK